MKSEKSARDFGRDERYLDSVDDMVAFAFVEENYGRDNS